jgi:hypothetical protein
VQCLASRSTRLEPEVTQLANRKPTMKQFITKSIAAFGILLASCSPGHANHTDSHVRFVAPDSQAVLSGLVDVRLDIVIPESVKTFELGVDGEEMVNPPVVSNTLKLNTREIKNGSRTLVVKVTGESGQQWSDSITVEIRNPDFQLFKYQTNAVAYSKGDTVTLDLSYPAAGLTLNAEFSALDDNFRESGVTSTDLGNGSYRLEYTLSPTDGVPAGHYEVTVSATNANGETTSTGIDLTLREGPRLPFTIDQAVFIDESTVPVSVTTQSAPAIQEVSGAAQLVSGATQQLNVRWTQPEGQPADRIFIRAANYSGYYVIPVANAPSQQASIPLNLQNAQGSPQSSDLDLLIAISDAAGRITNWVTHYIATQTLAAYGAQVTLFWSNSADLDLKVKSPNGTWVGYGTPSADGGSLELDANSMCTKSPIAAERISWAPGNAIPGQYTVAASIYDSCGEKGTSFSGVISYCGKTQSFSGEFSAADVATGTREKQVATFNVDCINRLHGAVSYEKFYRQNKLAHDFRSAFVPIRAVTNGTAERTVIAETRTDEAGEYSLYLPVGIGANYSLEVDASFTPPGASAPFASVMAQNASAAYRFTIPGADTSQGGETEQRVLIHQADNAGALNILDQIEKCYYWLTAHLGASDQSKIPPVVARWTKGKDTPALPRKPGDPPSSGPVLSYYWQDAVYIGGLDRDTSEYDDPVVAHEFNHHVAYHLGLPSAGGKHYFQFRTNPPLAFSEAIATALGQQSLGYPRYWDNFDKWLTEVNLENRQNLDNTLGVDYGTDNNDMRGNVNEFLDADILWDLMDPAGGKVEPWDRFDGTYAETLGSLAHYMPLTNRLDRGATGADLVDFLDGWRCQRSSMNADNADLSVLLKERDFRYEFTPLTCPR